MRQPVPDFNFLCGVFRSREASLASAGKIESLLAAPGVQEAAALLPEGRLSSEVQKAPTLEGIDAGYRAEIAELKDLISKYSPSPALNDLTFLPWDFFNLKVALLSKLSGKGGEELFGPEGSITTATLAAMAAEMRFEGLPAPLSASLAKALPAYYENDRSTQSLEIALDRQKQLRLIEIARDASPQVRDYFVNLSNHSIAEIFVRAHLAGIPWPIIKPAFDEHDEASRLKDLYTVAIADWQGRLSTVSQESVRLILSGASAATDVHTMLIAERAKAAGLMKDWRFKPPSLEYALYFVNRKIMDVRNLRLILVCKLNRIPASEIRKRLTDALV